MACLDHGCLEGALLRRDTYTCTYAHARTSSARERPMTARGFKPAMTLPDALLVLASGARARSRQPYDKVDLGHDCGESTHKVLVDVRLPWRLVSIRPAIEPEVLPNACVRRTVSA